MLLRRIIAVGGDAAVRVRLRPSAEFDQEPMRELRRQDGVWTATTGKLQLRWTGAAFCQAGFDSEDGLAGDIIVPAGGQHDLILEISDEPLPAVPIDANIAWSATETAWAAAVPTVDNTLNGRDSSRSYAVMRGLTADGGGMVAAATTSLPERAEAGRNYDYRYVWIRDQCYAGRPSPPPAPTRCSMTRSTSSPPGCLIMAIDCGPRTPSAADRFRTSIR